MDFIFYPEKQGDDGIILELKIDDTPEAVIRQIKDRKYILKFRVRWQKGNAIQAGYSW